MPTVPSAQQFTPEQSVSILRELANHSQLRFLNAAEMAAVQQALTVLDTTIRGPTPVVAE